MMKVNLPGWAFTTTLNETPVAVLTLEVLQRAFNEIKAMDADDRRDEDEARFYRATQVSGPCRRVPRRKALPAGQGIDGNDT